MEKDPLIEKFFNIVDDAVALNIARQIKFEDSKKYMSPAHWLADFCTVSIDVGRQSGKSLYINKRVTNCDLVICMNEDHKRHIFKNVANVNTARELFDVMNRFGRFRGDTRNKDAYWNKVYVDEPHAVFGHQTHRQPFYDLLAGHCNQVIMLGTPVR